jgi:hypothetical protein
MRRDDFGCDFSSLCRGAQRPSARLWAHMYRAVKVRFGQTLSGP